DDVEFRILEVARGVDVAHERGNARRGLRDSFELDAAAGLRDAGQVYAVGQLLRDLVEDVHDLWTRALQLLDDFHARDEARLVGLEAVDLLDLLVELGDL